MLGAMRKNVKGFLVKAIIGVVVFAFIGTIFLVWGVGDQKEHKGRILANVFGEEVPYQEYTHEYRQLYEYYRNQFKGNWSQDMAERLQLKKIAIDNVINRRVMIHEATRQGISVNDEEVMDKIRSMQIFFRNGRFDPRMYARVLEFGMHMDAATFEHQIKRGLIIDRLRERLKGGIKVSKRELLDIYSEQNEKVEADYILLAPAKFISEVSVADDEIQAYFEKHEKDYELPQQRKIRYIYIDSQSLKESLTIDEEPIQKHYETYKEKYRVPKEVQARHILIKINPQDDEATKEAAKKKTEDLLKRIKEGEDFAKLAKEFSEDAGSAVKGGDVGYFKKGRMTPDFEQAAFDMGKGEVSDVVETPFGYHIIKVEDIKAARTKLLEEVKQQILTQLLNEKAWEEAEDKAYNLVRSFYKTGQLEEIAVKAEYPVGQTEFAEGSKTIPNIGQSEEFGKAAFELKKDEVSMLVRANTGFYILRLIEEIPPRIPELAKIREEVVQGLKKEKAEEKVKELAGEFSNKLQTGKVDFTSLAKEYQLTVKNTGEISHQGYIKGLGSNQELSNALFRLKEGEYTQAINTNRGYCIAVLKKRISVDLNKFKEEEESLREQTLRAKEQQLISVWVERTKRENNIIVDYNNV